MTKDCLKYKKIVKILIAIIVFSCMIIPYNSYATNVQFNYTKEYLDWLDLSDEEKQNKSIPQMISVSERNINERNFMG